MKKLSLALFLALSAGAVFAANVAKADKDNDGTLDAKEIMAFFQKKN